MSSEFFGPARLRRWAANTRYGLMAFFDRNNHVAPEVDKAVLDDKFGTATIKVDVQYKKPEPLTKNFDESS